MARSAGGGRLHQGPEFGVVARQALDDYRSRHDNCAALGFSPEALALAVKHLSAALYPVRLGGFRGEADGEDRFVAEALEAGFAILRAEILSEFAYWQGYADEAFDADQPERLVALFAAP